jgi:hypothetical protein
MIRSELVNHSTGYRRRFLPWETRNGIGARLIFLRRFLSRGSLIIPFFTRVSASAGFAGLLLKRTLVSKDVMIVLCKAVGFVPNVLQKP